MARSPAAAWLLRVWPRDADGNEVEKRISTHGLLTLPWDSLATKAFPGGLMEPPTISISAFEAGAIGGMLDVGHGGFRIANPRNDAGWAKRNSWLTLYWNNARYEAYWAESKPGPPRSFDDYELILSGRIERLIRDEEHSFSLAARSRRAELDREIQVPTYRGAGPRCVRAVAAKSASCGDVLDQTGSFSFAFLIKPIILTTLSQKLFWKFNSGSNTGYGLELSYTAGNEGRMRFRIGGLSTVNLATPASAALAVGTEFYRVVCTYSSSTGVRCIYIDGECVATDTVTGTPVANADSLNLFTGIEADVLDFAFWSGTALTSDQVEQIGRGPVEPDELSATNYWTATEGSGTTLTDSKGSTPRNATLTASTTWASSLEGPVDLREQPKPIALGGTMWNVEPVLVDPVERIFQCHHRAIRTFGGVRSRGAILVEGTGGGTNYTKAASTATITVHTLPGDPGVTTLNITAGDDGGSWDAEDWPSIVRYLTTVVGPLTDADLYYDGSDDPFGVAKGSTWVNLAPMELFIRAGGNLLEVLDHWAQAQGAALFFDPTRSDKLWAVRLDKPTGAADLTLRRERDFGPIQVVESLNPTAAQRVAWQWCYRTMTSEELVASDASMGTGGDAVLGAAFRAFVAPRQLPRQDPDTLLTTYQPAPYRVVEVPALASVKTKFPLAVKSEVLEGHFTRARDAYAEARRRQTGWHGGDGIEGILLRFTRKIDNLRLGMVIQITDPQIHGGSAKKFVLTGLNFAQGEYGEATLYG